MPNNVFILSLDIDETLINSKSTTKQDVFDFNGSDTFNDASVWLDMIAHAKTLCEIRGYQLIVKLITAKKGKTVDDTVDACHRYLPRLFIARTENGNAYDINEDTFYYAQLHVDGQIRNERFSNLLFLNNKDKKGEGWLVEDDFMPAIHVCQNNLMMGSSNAGNYFYTSKACVLEKVRLFYDIEPEQMLHVDNSLCVEADLKSGAKGLTPTFFNVMCHDLETLMFSDKRNRTVAAQTLISHLKDVLVIQINTLPDLSEKMGAHVAENALKFLSLRGSQSTLYRQDDALKPRERLLDSIKKELLDRLNDFCFDSNNSIPNAPWIRIFISPFVCSGRLLPYLPSSEVSLKFNGLKALLSSKNVVYVDDVLKHIEGFEKNDYLSKNTSALLLDFRAWLNRSLPMVQDERSLRTSL